MGKCHVSQYANFGCLPNRAESGLIFSILQYVLYRKLILVFEINLNIFL